MEALLTYGGVYMDIDLVALKPMDALIAEGHSCILGQEMTAEGSHPHGLGNAYMLAAKGAPFFQEWYQGYKKFDFHQWAALSVHLPIRLSHAMPGYCHELSPFAFYFPSFDESGKRAMYLDNEWDLSQQLRRAPVEWGQEVSPGAEDGGRPVCAQQHLGPHRAHCAAGGEGNANACNGRGIA